MLYRKRYGIPPTWGASAGTATELHFILDNEAVRWMAGEVLRVCGRCEAQTYFDVCPELCRTITGEVVELHEGHLTNVVATMRAEGRDEEVEDVFKELEKRHPFVAPDDAKIRWSPDAKLQRDRERNEQAVMTKLREADGRSDQ